MTEFNKTRWSKKGFVYEYLETTDIRIVGRRRLLETLKSFYRHFFEDKQQIRALDLGCGDGIIMHELLKIDNSISATLLDGSEDMLDKAKERLDGIKNIHFIRASFQEVLNGKIELPLFDLIASSLAIHHLRMNEKKSLFNYIYSHLTNGGYFVNIDVILSPTEALEKWYLTLWKEWIIEKQAMLKLEDNYENIICNYKESDHYNNLDTLTNQLNALKDIGFKDVDCFYKYGVFSMYGGKK